MKKKGSSSSWKIFCVVCFPQKRNGVEVHHYKKKVSRLNRSWRVEALEKSAEATRRAFKQHHAILHPTEKCCVPHSDFFALVYTPFSEFTTHLLPSVLLFQVLFCLYKPIKKYFQWYFYLSDLFDNYLLKWNSIEPAKVGRFIAIKQNDLVQNIVTLLYKINTVKDLIFKSILVIKRSHNWK